MITLNLYFTLISNHFYEGDISLTIAWDFFCVGTRPDHEWFEFYLPRHEFEALEHLLWVTRSERLVRWVAPCPIYIHPDGTIEDDPIF